MKKIISTLVATALSLSLLVGCGSTAGTNENKLVVAASPTPHTEILNVAKGILANQGIELVVKEFTDYVQPNMVTESGDVDANFFQHQPYLDNFNKENKTHLVTVASIHYEPLGIYAGKTLSLDQIPNGAQIAVPNDATNEARALMLLEAQGIIKLKEGAGINATKLSIVENPKNIEIVEIEAAQLARTLKDVDLAVINGNYATEAGLNVETDALAKEEKNSEAAQTYANILVVKEGNEKNENILALIEALKSEEVKTFIEENYAEAVIPIF